MARSALTPSPSPSLPPAQGLTGVRGEFVASLGKRIQDARKALARVRGGPADPAVADFARRVHALLNSARLFRFDAMAETLAALEKRIECGRFEGEQAEFASVLDRLPELAWTVTPSRPPVAVAIAAAPAEEASSNEIDDAGRAIADALCESEEGGPVASGRDQAVTRSSSETEAELRALAHAEEAALAPLSAQEDVAQTEPAATEELAADPFPATRRAFDVALAPETSLAPETPTRPAPVVAPSATVTSATTTECAAQIPSGPPVLLVVGSMALESLPWPSRRLASTDALVVAALSQPPAIVLVDADLPEMDLFFEEWMDDARTEAIPVIVMGTFPGPGSASRFVALGAARVLEKPVSVEVLLRELRAYLGGTALSSEEPVELAAATSAHVSAETTTEQMDAEGVGGSEEMDDKAFVSAPADASPESYNLVSSWIPDTADVLHDISSTLSRIRALVDKPVPPRPKMISSLVESAGTRSTGGRHGQAHVSLEGRTVLVADHDPGIVWFFADVLRAQGAFVIEATDGPNALELALKHLPDLVLADILLPVLDGLELTRTLKSDVVLRDVPVILLSWKDDLPRRARELGVQADGFLRKESGEGVVLARVREALWTKARFEDRVISPGIIKGRLDGLAPATLLRLITRYRKEARLVLEDDVHTLEVHVRGGKPRLAARFGPSPLEGREVIASLLALRSARFAVLDLEGITDEPNLEGELEDLLAPLVARARGAAHALSGHRLFSVDRVELDLEAVTSELATFPPSARAIVDALSQGTSVARLIRAVDIDQLEAVLTFLAWRGLVRRITFVGASETSDAHTTTPTPPTDEVFASLLSSKSPEPPFGERVPRTDIDTVYRVSDLSPGTVQVAPHPFCDVLSDIPLDVEQPVTPLASEVSASHPQRERKGLYVTVAVLALGLFFVLSGNRIRSIGVATAPPADESTSASEGAPTLQEVVQQIPAAASVTAAEVPSPAKGLDASAPLP